MCCHVELIGYANPKSCIMLDELQQTACPWVEKAIISWRYELMVHCMVEGPLLLGIWP